MRDFDAEIVDLLETEPLVTGVYRVNPNEDRFGLYAVRVEPGTAKEPTEVLRDKIFDTLGASLDVNFVEEIDVAWTPLWERGVDDFESASYAEDYEKMHGRPPRDLQVTFGDTDRVLTGVDQHGTPMTEVVHCGAPKPPRRRLPTIEELIAHNRAHLLRERNALIAEDGLPGIAVCAFVIDVSDRYAPPKFFEMAGGAEFVARCRAHKDLPLAVGVMPREIIIKHITPVAHRLAGTQSSMIIMADPVEPAVPRLVRLWKDVGRMPIVTLYEQKLGVFDTPVPAILSGANMKMPSRMQ